MIDVVDGSTRSRMMAGIKGKNTKPELLVRRYLHLRGYRFRLHRNDLPGKPDLVLPKYKLVIFVHGCFWHMHADCFYSKLPATRVEFWKDKLVGNVARDQLHVSRLNLTGWRVIVVWECGLKCISEQFHEVVDMIESNVDFMTWPATPPRKKNDLM